MKHELWFISQVLKFYSKAVNAHGIHPPFLFDFYRKAIRKGGIENATDFKQIEVYRKQLFRDKTPVILNDLGAGSRVDLKERTVSSIAKNSGTPANMARRLFRMTSYLKSKQILELGTNLGLGTAYLALNTQAKVTTVEGDKTLSKRATESLQALGYRNVNFIGSSFEDFMINDKGNYDFVFIDGNHTYSATLAYYEWVKAHVTEKACVVFDDIRWNREMYRAWKEICQKEEFQLYLDLFQQGIIIKDVDLSTQYFYLL